MSERKGTKALELWCKRLVKDCPEVQIDNMTTSWRNGMAFCALVHHFRPDLIDMSKLRPENIYENNQLAFSIAEKHLGIPALLDPEDMVENEVPDRLSVLTYLSQFYQRLGHTVNTKASESESKPSVTSPEQSTGATAPLKFGKAGLDKCAACDLPVYLAQRLIVSHKLYHRSCFRCSTCAGHINPKNFELTEGSDFFCDSCKNEKALSKFLNNNDQIGMLAFSDDVPVKKPDSSLERPIRPKHKARPQSILDKINMFESNTVKDTNIENKLDSLSLKDNVDSSYKALKTTSIISSTSTLNEHNNQKSSPVIDSKLTEKEALDRDDEKSQDDKMADKVYKSNINKFNFLQTQLTGDVIDSEDTSNEVDEMIAKKEEECAEIIDENTKIKEDNSSQKVLKEENNVTDDTRIANRNSFTSQVDSPTSANTIESNNSEQDIQIPVPPRKKKILSSPDKVPESQSKHVSTKSKDEEYPDHLNPFSDDEEDEPKGEKPKNVSTNTNPFGSSDEEDDDVPPIQSPPKVHTIQATPARRLISANPFWSDSEEPSSDEETHGTSTMLDSSSMATSTPNLPNSGTPKRKKGRAPPPPPTITFTEPQLHIHPATSMDDVASISSLSSYNSTIHSDQKSLGISTPHLKKRLAPTPPDSLSTVSMGAGSMERGVDTAGRHNTSESARKMKGPAPGLPLPERREVKLQMSPAELQVQLDLLETQQIGLERQGVLIEQMIRDKCEGDEGSTAPQEEVEDLVIQLCELVNEKNDLFRKQTELMYIRRQQRLEQEQADIEHEIRVIQSRPAVNRCDADKAREEQLVLRLVQMVRMRDELVQQIDAERRREQQEDLAIAASIATKRAQRNSESNSSSMKSVEVIPAAAPKKNKVKDKVKKQLKKAKHSLISKKKDDSGDHKQEKIDKDKKAK